MNPLTADDRETSPFSARHRLIFVACTLLVAAPWWWPVVTQPVLSMWPDLSAWMAGALLIALLPLARERAGLAMAWGWLLAALFSTVLGLMQYFNLEDGFFPWIAMTPPGYVSANVHQLNVLATLLAVGLLSLWWLLIQRRISAPHATWMAALLLTTLAATASRTGLVHLVIISGLLLYWHAQQWKRVLLALAAGWACYAIASAALPWLAWVVFSVDAERNLLDRFGAAMSCSSRRVLWSNVVDLIALKPWTGWGPGNLLYAHYITEFEGMRFCEKLSHAHNLPLQVAVTLGLPVAAAVCGLLVYAFFRFKPWTAKDPMERLCWAVLALLGLHSLLEYPLWAGTGQLMAALAIWQIHRIRRHGSETAVTPAPASGVRRRLALSGLMLALVTFVAWDYLKVTQLYLPVSMRLDSYREDTFRKIEDTAFFQRDLLIARLDAMPLNRENAQFVLAGALASLRTATDPRVIEYVIGAAWLLGQTDLAQLHEARYRAAWPKEYEVWRARLAQPS